MAFNPSSTIYLCNAPIDSTYQHQIYFTSKSAQFEYFYNKRVYSLTEYLTARKTKAGGGVQSSIKVGYNIDDLYKCNYMCYQNANHGTKWFYAFITDLVYINENTTEILFETDVWQTWGLDVTLKECYVEREHSVTDERGENVVPESFTFQDYIFDDVTDSHTSDENYLDVSTYGYLVGSSDYIKCFTEILNKTNGGIHSGVYQGLHFYYFRDAIGVSNFITLCEDAGKDCIQFICAIPEFCVSGATFESATEKGYVISSNKPAERSAYINITFAYSNDFEPRNNKLYTAPFFQLIISNSAGDVAEYSLEDFYLPEISVEFRMYGDISASPSVTLIPKNYRGVAENIDQGISISGFPQCSFTSDTFKLWLAKNQYTIAMDVLGGLGQIGTGVFVTAKTGGVGGAIGAGQIWGGISQIANTINSVHQASKQPNSTKGGATKNNLLTAMGRNTFKAYIRKIKPTYAKIIDDFFTMFGYQTNALKVPNISSRPFYNYVKTADCNIKGTIPANDMKQMKAMFNNGVTFWKPNATIGDYTNQNNKP